MTVTCRQSHCTFSSSCERAHEEQENKYGDLDLYKYCCPCHVAASKGKRVSFTACGFRTFRPVLLLLFWTVPSRALLPWPGESLEALR